MGEGKSQWNLESNCDPSLPRCPDSSTFFWTSPLCEQGVPQSFFHCERSSTLNCNTKNKPQRSARLLLALVLSRPCVSLVNKIGTTELLTVFDPCPQRNETSESDTNTLTFYLICLDISVQMCWFFYCIFLDNLDGIVELPVADNKNILR